MTKRPQSCSSSRYCYGCDSSAHRIVAYPQVHALIRNLNSSHRVHYSTKRTVLAAAACALLSGLVGCGSPASDPASGLASRATTSSAGSAFATRGSHVGAQGAGQASDGGVSAGGDRSGQRGQSSAGQSVLAAGMMDGGTPPSAPNIPEAIAKNLSSPDARDRYRALDHWDAKDAKAPLDPVFEALEDVDEAVRAKATAIVERYWAMEQERERG